MNVLSLFDGCSGGQQALNRIGIVPDKYFASEIDKYAIQVTMANYPNTIQLGSVVNVDVSTLPKIDLLCGGSPCQSFSFAGKRKGMSTKDNQEIYTIEHYLQLKSEGFEFEGQSYLFWEYMRILTDIRKINPDVKFLLENVMMVEKWERTLSTAIGVEPIMINSALVSAQNRKRLYWFGQSRERLFFNDNYCYICQNDLHKNKRIFGESSNTGEESVLGETQKRQVNVRDLSVGIYENNSQGDNKNLFENLSIETKENKRQESEPREKENLSEGISKKEQRKIIALSKELSENSEREGSIETDGRKSIKENCKDNANSSSSGINWTKEEAEKRRIDYYSKYDEDMCCVQCGKRLDHRPYRSVVEGWDKYIGKFPSALSETQFNEARQNNGRVFDILEIGVIGLSEQNTLFGGEQIDKIPQPKDKKILLKDILETNVDEKYFLKEDSVKRLMDYSKRQKENGNGFTSKFHEEEMSTLKVGGTGCDDLIVHNMMPRSGDPAKGGTGHLSRNDGKTYCLDTGNTNAVEIFRCIKFGRLDEGKKNRKESMKKGIDHTPFQQKEITGIDYEKMNTLTTGIQKDNLIMGGDFRYDEGFRWREEGKSGTSCTQESCGQFVMLNDNQQKKFNPDINSDKANTLTLAQGRAGSNSEYMDAVSKIANITSLIRRLTPVECERLQTVADGYTAHVSDTQRYRMLGNGWTIDVIAHILSFMNK